MYLPLCLIPLAAVPVIKALRFFLFIYLFICFEKNGRPVQQVVLDHISQSAIEDIQLVRKNGPQLRELNNGKAI